MTEEDRVTIEMDKSVVTLEFRLITMEQGYIHDYLRTVDGLRRLTQEIGENPKNVHIYETDWRNHRSYLETMYRVFKSKIIPRVEDTQPYFVCQKIYDDSIEARLNSLGRRISSINDDPDSRTVLQNLLWALGNLSEESRRVKYKGVLEELRSHSGYEDNARTKEGIWVTHPLCSNPEYNCVGISEVRANPPLP
ncbi:MAG: hypothetical protein KJ896_01840 [Nanoarchaeota archaeon]|nr:hypothetical protein [Nanoarchaeota archaeon]